MANIELMKTNLTKNEEKLAKKIALLAKYESKKTKLSSQWEKLYNESFNDSMKKIYSLEEDNLSVYGKIIKYYGEKGYDIYDKLYSFTCDEDYWNPINQTKKGIKELEKRCQKYRDSIAEEEKKVADRKASIEEHTISVNGKDVNVIIEFLNNWEKKVTEHYMHVYEKYVTEAKSYYEENIKGLVEYKFENTWGLSIEDLETLWATSEYTKYYSTWMDYNKAPYRNECSKVIREVIEDAEKTYSSIFNTKAIEKYAKTLHNPKKEVFEENMRKDIAKEKNRKYDQLIEDCENIVGKIIDMSHIKVGHLGDLEGYVIGTNGECELWSTGCGGWNENVIVNVKHGQCFHFRFYVKRRA